MPDEPMSQAGDALVAVLRAAGRTTEDLHTIGTEVTNLVKVRLSQPGTGRTYTSTRGGHRHLHQASAPGEPPAVDLGILRASYGYTVDERRGETAVGSHDDRAPWLEFGTSQHGKTHIEPRPALQPSVLAYTPQIPGVVASGMVARERRTAREHGGRG